jgi:hypothetical protein
MYGEMQRITDSVIIDCSKVLKKPLTILGYPLHQLRFKPGVNINFLCHISFTSVTSSLQNAVVKGSVSLYLTLIVHLGFVKLCVFAVYFLV